MKHSSLISRFLVALLLTATVAFAQTAAPGVPPLIKFNGVLNDSSGQALEGTNSVTFSIYSEQSGGTPLWQEMQNVQFAQGNYNVVLGSSNNEGVPATLFSAGQPRWLGVRAVLPGEEEQPRILLASVPYALKAVDADTVGGLPASAFVQAVPAAQNGAATSGGSMTTSTSSTHYGAHPPTSMNVTTSGGTVNTIPMFDSISDITNSPLSDSSGEIVTQNFESVLYADQFPGSDIGQQVNNAYAACPAYGCRIKIPANAGCYSFSNEIKINTYSLLTGIGKPATIEGDGRTCLKWTPSTGTAILFDYGQNNTWGGGMKDITLLGPCASSTSPYTCTSSAGATGVQLGSSNGATGVYLENVTIGTYNLVTGTGNSFSTGVMLVTVSSDLGTFIDRFLHVNCVGNYYCLNAPINSNFENITWDGGCLCSNQYAAWLAGGAGDFRFENVSFDGNVKNAIYGSGQNYVLILSHNHFENAGGATATYVNVTGAVDGFMTNNTFQDDGTSTATEFVNWGGNFLTLTGNYFLLGKEAQDVNVTSGSVYSYGNFSTSPTSPVIGSSWTGRLFECDLQGTQNAQTCKFQFLGITTKPGVFSALGACNAASDGTMGAISDSTTVGWGDIISGGGTLHVLAYCDGTNWTVAAR